MVVAVRYGGLRCPSEVLSLQWQHVDWEHSRITVISPKTERYDGKGSRVIPIFTALRPYLQDAFERAEPGQTHVIGGNHLAKAQRPTGWKSCNLRTQFGRLVAAAGLERWPRLFHNLRSSCETELLEHYPVHVVARWLGHDPKVCLQHYAQTTDEHFERASGGAKSGAVGCENDPAIAQKAAQQVAAAPGAESRESMQVLIDQLLLAAPCETVPSVAQNQGGEGGIRTLDRV